MGTSVRYDRPKKCPMIDFVWGQSVAETVSATGAKEYRKVRHREGTPQEGSPQNWKVHHSFKRFATNVIGRFATTLECIMKQVTTVY